MDEWNWSNGVDAIWRGRYRILLVTLVAGILTASVVVLVPRSYEAVVTVRIGRVMDKPLQDASHVAAGFNGSGAWASRLAPGVYDGSPDDLSDKVSVTAASATSPFVTIAARAQAPDRAVRLASGIADLIIADDEDRYERLVERHTRYRDDLAREISTLKSEIGEIGAELKAARAHPPAGTPGMLLARAQLEEKQDALLTSMSQLRDAEVGLGGQTERTRTTGKPIVPRSRVQPQRAMVTLAGSAAGALLAIFWVLASDSVHRGAAAADVVAR